MLCLSLQVQCYEDNRLLKLFSDIVRLLYDADIVGEDTIMHWCVHQHISGALAGHTAAGAR